MAHVFLSGTNEPDGCLFIQTLSRTKQTTNCMGGNEGDQARQAILSDQQPVSAPHWQKQRRCAFTSRLQALDIELQTHDTLPCRTKDHRRCARTYVEKFECRQNRANRVVRRLQAASQNGRHGAHSDKYLVPEPRSHGTLHRSSAQ